MTPFHNRLTPLTRRMAEDMMVRNLSESTVGAPAGEEITF